MSVSDLDGSKLIYNPPQSIITEETSYQNNLNGVSKNISFRALNKINGASRFIDIIPP